jgi:hypothetical protein
VIPLFHYSLKPNGFLMLGSSESADQFGPLFSPVDKQWKIYSKTPGTQASYDQFPFRPPFTKTEPVLEKTEEADDSAEFDVGKAADRILAQYTPGILINDKGQVIEYRGETGLYLRHAPGRPSSNVLKLVREELMVGDTGSNPMGAAVGLGVVVAFGPAVRLSVLVVVLALNLLSERVSFSSVIDRTPPLRYLDRLGRRA